MPKRGRPPKNKPLNTADSDGRGPGSHHGSQEKSKKLPKSFSSNSNNNNEQNIKLYIPPIDVLENMISNDNIGRISRLCASNNINPDEYLNSSDEEDKEDEEDLFSDKQVQSQPINMDLDELQAAYDDMLQFRQYILDCKELINQQLETLKRTEKSTLPYQFNRSSYFRQHNDQTDSFSDMSSMERTNSMGTDIHSTQQANYEFQDIEQEGSSTQPMDTDDMNVDPPQQHSTTSSSKATRRKNRILESDDDIDIVDVEESHQQSSSSRQNTFIEGSDQNSQDDLDKSNEDYESGGGREHRGSKKGAPKKNKKKSSSSTSHSNYNEMKKKNKRADSGFNDDPPPKNQHHGPTVGPSTFWASMDSYFKFITESDISHITPKSDDYYSRYFNIPSLGQHYTEVWHQEDQDRYGSSSTKPQPPHRQLRTNSFTTDQEEQQTTTTTTTTSSSTNDNPLGLLSDEIYMGDLSMRLLSALIEENIVISSPTETSAHPPNSNSGEIQLKANQFSNSYSVGSQKSLEQRIQLELKSLGIYDDYVLGSPSHTSSSQQHQNSILNPSNNNNNFIYSSREDDEICTELRFLQNKLKTQLEINNQIKSQALKECKSILNRQESLKKKKMFQANSEKNYQKLLRRDRKKRRLKSTLSNNSNNNSESQS
ncbi:hypothetical protein DLAC_00615 [Tieghemostelium lacteum]|uniref:Uncharacterized protein n=1 Tax=Tieghemostelium lacteum TaxID=361077 RepID=A0A152AA73_TIELA|nr:hypothetical protein DLAC_00615 [Tieghemostelium lacteum]|eukprot:KYR03120.1 hypothetical protein DLAC_00615 [Tieghemostelium lacteum]